MNGNYTWSSAGFFCGEDSQAPFILCSKALVLSLDKRL